MKYSGRARKAAFKLILITLVAGLVLWGIVGVASFVGTILAVISVPVLLALWVLFSVFTLFFFRDPTPEVPAGKRLIVAPAHGRVDVIDQTTEPQFMGGECHRISIFLSVFNVHVQNAPVSGRVGFFKYTMGEFMNALRKECADCNENLYMGFEATDPPATKVGVRLIAGVIARRIVPFVQMGEEVTKGGRIALIQFGSRANVYLPLNAKIRVSLDQKVVGGETVLAEIE
jgi:phosphatidylserine decarboxylase